MQVNENKCILFNVRKKNTMSVCIVNTNSQDNRMLNNEGQVYSSVSSTNSVWRQFSGCSNNYWPCRFIGRYIAPSRNNDLNPQELCPWLYPSSFCSNLSCKIQDVVMPQPPVICYLIDLISPSHILIIVHRIIKINTLNEHSPTEKIT